MQIRLYVDEDAMARALVRGLRARGVDVTTVLDAGMSEQDDMAQLEYATEHGRVLYTFNVGYFCQLHAQYMAQGKSHAGIIVVFRQRYAVGEQQRRLLQLVSMKSAEDDEKQRALPLTAEAIGERRGLMVSGSRA